MLAITVIIVVTCARIALGKTSREKKVSLSSSPSLVMWYPLSLRSLSHLV